MLYLSLTIAGDLFGRIEITELIPLAELTVHGNVKPDASIEITDMLGPSSLRAYPIDPCGTGLQPVQYKGCRPVPHFLG